MPQFVPHIPITTNAKVANDLSGGIDHGLKGGETVNAYDLSVKGRNGRMVWVSCPSPKARRTHVLLNLDSCEVRKPTFSDRRAQNGLYLLYCAKHNIDMTADTEGQLTDTPAPTTELSVFLTISVRQPDPRDRLFPKKTNPRRQNGKRRTSQKPPPARGNPTGTVARL